MIRQSFSHLRRLPRSVLWASAILLVQSVVVHSLGWDRSSPGRLFPDFRSIPITLGQWRILDEEPIPKPMLDLLRPDDYFHRTYLEDKEGLASKEGRVADLFVAYFSSAESVNRPHSPEACLPGSGWVPIGKDYANLSGTDASSVSLTRIVLRKEAQTILVLFWYQSDRRTWARESLARIQMIPEILLHGRSELAVVRIATTIDATLDSSLSAKMDRFASDVHKQMNQVLNGPRLSRKLNLALNN